jgi:hypothetical protein
MALLLSANVPRMFLSSSAGSVLLTRVATSYAPTTSYVGNFLILLFGQLFVFLTWKVVIWPKLLSPLRNLPQPRVNQIPSCTIHVTS